MISVVLILFVALLFPGLIARTRAVLSGRKGVRFYQHISNIGVLFQKDPVYNPIAGFMTRLIPILYVGCIVTAMLLLPVGEFPAVLSFSGDIVLFCYLLGASRLLLILGALDAGSSFQGMGASREALYGAFLEPAIFIVLGTLALISGQTSFESIWVGLATGRPEMMIVLFLLWSAVFMILITESGRIPVDDPKTHLELTMIHEVMVLDYSGFDLGLITLGGWIKSALWAVLGAGTLVSVFGGMGLFVVVVALAMAVLVGGIESFATRQKLSRNMTYILTIIAIAFLTFIIAFLLMQNIQIG